MSFPEISVVVPAYNSGKYIRQCLDSIISQTYPDWETIIVLAPSTDNTMDILRGYFKEPRIKIIRENSKSNCATARNRGFSESKGRYLYFLDADDWLEPKCFETMFGVLQKRPLLSWCVNQQVAHWDTGRTVLLDKIPGTHSSIGGIGGILFRKECLEDIKKKSGHLFNENLNHTDDGDLILRARRYSCEMVPAILSHYRWNEEGLTANTPWLEQEWYMLKILISNNAWDLIPGHLMEAGLDLVNRTFGIDIVKIKKGLWE